MSHPSWIWNRAARLIFIVAGLVGIFSAVTYAGSPPCDFSDEFYRANGINPIFLTNRVNGDGTVSIVDPASCTDPSRNDTRVKETTGGYNDSANLIYYNIFAFMPNDAVFTNDAAGDRARQNANSFRAFIFPLRSGDPLSPAPENRRQDNVFDTRNGYFSNNPLGLWLLAFVSYTDKALKTAEGQKLLKQLAQKNGSDLDGTPILNSASDIDNLAQKGFVQIRSRNLDGGEGFPWVV